MNIMKFYKTALVICLGGLLLAFVWGQYLSKMKTAIPRVASSGPSSIASNNQLDLSHAKSGRVDGVEVESAKHAALAKLTGNDEIRWVRALGTDLSRLTLPDIWDVLNTPGVEQQLQSKILRQSIAQSCLGRIRELEIKGQSENSKPSLLNNACSALLTKIDSSTLAKQSLQIAGDNAYQTADYHVIAAFNPIKADAKEVEVQRQLSTRALEQTTDPWLAQAGARTLWELKSTDLASDWSEIAALSRFQSSRLKDVIAIDRACALSLGCGPNSPWTLNFCAMMPGTQCPANSSFDEIVSLNLSPVELELRQKILANLAKRYPY